MDPGQAAEIVDALWPELEAAWGARFKALEELLADPERRAAALAEHEAEMKRLRGQVGDLAKTVRSESQRLGNSPEIVADLEARLAHLERAARTAAFLLDEYTAGTCEYQRAALLQTAERSAEARAAVEKALARYTDAGQARLMLQALLVQLHRKLDDPALALALADEILPALVAARLERFAASVQNTRELVYVELGMPDLALKGVRSRWEQAEKLRERSEIPLALARHEYLALLRAVGDEKTVQDLAPVFLADTETYADPRDEGRLLVQLGAAELDSPLPGALERGRDFMRAAVELGLEPEQRLFVHVELAEVDLAEGALARAALELAAARALIAAKPAAFDGPELRSSVVTLEAQLALARGAPHAELAPLRAELDRSIDELFARWAKAPERAGGIAFALYPSRLDLVGDYTRLSVALDGAEAGARLGFERVLELQMHGTLARRAGAAPTSVGEIRAELLGPGHGVLVFLPAKGRSHVFALDDEQLVHAELARSWDLEQLRAQYMSLYFAAPSALADEAQRSGFLARERELAATVARELLPEPVRARLRAWSAVTIVGLDLLGPLPFEWLPLDAEPHLGLTRAVDYLSSLPTGVAWARRPARGFERDYLLVGGAEPHPDVLSRWPELAPLPLGSELEGELSAPFAGRKIGALRGAAATRSALLDAGLGSVRVLQFLVHGVHEQERERSLALVLSPADAADDGLLRWEDATGTRAPALVLMTGCRTGRGPTRKGDPDVGGPQGAWLAAGADAVLVSDHDLELGAARRISAVFSEGLVGGASPAAALRDVRAELVREHGSEAPFRGGSLRLHGLGQRPVFPAPAASAVEARAGTTLPVLTAVLGCALGLVLGAGLVLRRRAVAAEVSASR